MTAEKILKQMKDEMPYSLPQYCEPYVLEAIKLGMSQSLPPVSEEEIIGFAEETWDDCSEYIGEDIDSLQMVAGRTLMTKFGFEKAVKKLLSRLPQREDEQPEEKKECDHDCKHISQGIHKPNYCSNCGEEL